MTTCLGLIANGLLIAGAWWLAVHGLHLANWLDRCLGASVLAFTWCLLSVEAPGTAGFLEIRMVLITSAALFIVGLAARQLRALARPEPTRDDTTEEPWSGDVLLALVLVAWTLVVLGMHSLLLPVKVVSDGPIYHLYFAARWWKAGRLFLVAAPFGENAATYFPANGDAWFAWLMVSWGGDRLAKVGQAPFLLLGAAAVFRMARTLAASRNSAIISTCWFVTSTPFLIFSFEPNVDTLFVAFYLIAVRFFLGYLRHESGTSAVILGGLAAGIAMGTKPVGVIFVVPLLLILMGAIGIRARSVGRTLAAALPVLGCTLLTSGFWYGRNLVLTGNPLYPLNLELFGRTILPGWYGRDAMRYSASYLPMSQWRALVDILLAVLDPRLSPLWLAALAGALVRGMGASRKPQETLWVGSLAFLSVLNIVLYWVFIPYRTQQRFMLQALGLAAVPLARLLDRWRGLRIIAAVLLALHLLTPQTWPITLHEAKIPWDLSPLIPNVVGAPLPLFERIACSPRIPADRSARTRLVVLLSMACFAGLGVGAATRTGRAVGSERRSRAIGLLSLSVVGLLAMGVLETGVPGADARQLFYPGFPDFYAGWQNLESRSGSGGTRVAYAGTNIPYYLLGAGLRNEVRYVNVDGHRDWLMHDYHRDAMARGEPTWPNSRPGWDRAQPDFQAWLANLQAEGIQLLVVTRVNPAEGPHNVADANRFPIERRWAESHPEFFEPLYGVDERDSFFRLYRLRKSERAAPPPRPWPPEACPTRRISDHGRPTELPLHLEKNSRIPPRESTYIGKRLGTPSCGHPCTEHR